MTKKDPVRRGPRHRFSFGKLVDWETLVGFACAAGLAFLAHFLVDHRDDGVHVTGTSVHVEERIITDLSQPAPPDLTTVRYRDLAGKEHVERVDGNYAVGTAVDLLYDPDNPGKVEAERFTHGAYDLWAAITALAALVTFVGTASRLASPV